MLVPKSAPAAMRSTTTTVNDTARRTDQRFTHPHIVAPPARSAVHRRRAGLPSHRAEDQAARYRLMTWPLNFVSRDEFWGDAFPTMLEGHSWTCCC